MIERRLIDTNLIVRHLVKDHEAHAKAAGKLFAACDAGKIRLVILPVVLAECVFVLESFYKHTRRDISTVMGLLVNSPGVELIDEKIYVDALSRFSKSKAHFIDCVLAATSVHSGMPVATFDADFRKFPELKVDVD